MSQLDIMPNHVMKILSKELHSIRWAQVAPTMLDCPTAAVSEEGHRSQTTCLVFICRTWGLTIYKCSCEGWFGHFKNICVRHRRRRTLTCKVVYRVYREKGNKLFFYRWGLSNCTWIYVQITKLPRTSNGRYCCGCLHRIPFLTTTYLRMVKIIQWR